MKSSNPIHPLVNVSSPPMVIRAFFAPPPRRSSPIPIARIVNRTPHLKILASNLNMAEQPKQAEQAEEINSSAKQETVVADTAPPPPPPEKPLADDCCGSGCVRCVWDVYYDELEEYNKLYSQK